VTTERQEQDTHDDIDDRELTFMEHLIELRSRLLKASLAVLVVLVVLLPFSRRLYTLLAAPLTSHLPEGSSMIAIDVASPFLTPFKLSLLLALIIAIPVVLYQLWAFVAPALYRHEKRLARPLLYSAVALFYLGCAFAYFVVFPLVFGFFTSVAPEGVSVMTDISRYLDFVISRAWPTTPATYLPSSESGRGRLLPTGDDRRTLDETPDADSPLSVKSVMRQA
jgi:sec-independent protein translocase protein TatC